VLAGKDVQGFVESALHHAKEPMASVVCISATQGRKGIELKRGPQTPTQERFTAGCTRFFDQLRGRRRETSFVHFGERKL
jgi:hypothetical protein